MAEIDDPRQCSICKQPLLNSYYKIENLPACSTCYETVLESTAGGSYVRAAIFGAVAGALGVGLYSAEVAITGYMFTPFAIPVGAMVGKAVGKGYDRRGGGGCQMLAVFLAYFAISAGFMAGFALAPANRGGNAGRVTAPAKNPASGKSGTSLQSPGSGAYTPSTPYPPSPPDPWYFDFIVYALAFCQMVAVLFILPIWLGTHSIITLLGIGFGLYAAWRLNRSVDVNISGPFPMSR